MKLRNKFLTALPISVIGLTAPIVISSCSCGTKTITINFGDKINCSDKNTKSPSYNKPDVIKASSIDKIVVIEDVQPIDWPSTGSIPQQFYWDLVYSGAYYGSYILTYDGDTNPWKQTYDKFKIKYNNTEITKIEYKIIDNVVWMVGTDTSKNEVQLTKSYTYHLYKES